VDPRATARPPAPTAPADRRSRPRLHHLPARAARLVHTPKGVRRDLRLARETRGRAAAPRRPHASSGRPSPPRRRRPLRKGPARARRPEVQEGAARSRGDLDSSQWSSGLLVSESCSPAPVGADAVDRGDKHRAEQAPACSLRAPPRPSSPLLAPLDCVRRRALTAAQPDRLALHLNIAACALRTADYDNAVFHATRALRTDPKNVKALFRRASAAVSLRPAAQPAGGSASSAVASPLQARIWPRLATSTGSRRRWRTSAAPASSTPTTAMHRSHGGQGGLGRRLTRRRRG